MPGIALMLSWGEYANHYTTDAVDKDRNHAISKARKWCSTVVT
jgi:hypothetical protein